MGVLSSALLASNILSPTPGSKLMMYANVTNICLLFFTVANRATKYRLLGPADNAVLLVVVILLGATITVHADGSNTTPWVVVFMANILFTSIYFGRWFGLVAVVGTITMYGAVMYMEYAGVIQYAPGYPQKQDAMNIGGAMFKDYITVCATGIMSWMFSAFAMAQVRGTSIKLEEANTKMAEMDRLKTQFLRVVSHDLRTPITSINAFGEIPEEEVPEEHKKYSRTIVDEADRLHRLVTNLLDLDKMEAGKMEWNLTTQDIRPVLENAARVFRAAAEDKGVTLNEDFATNVPSIPVPASCDLSATCVPISGTLSVHLRNQNS